MEEKSDRETTALDAHKELETVSLKAIKIKPLCSFPLQKKDLQATFASGAVPLNPVAAFQE